MNLNYFQDQFEMVKECKDPDIRDKQMSILMNNLEVTYDIPALNDEKFNQANPYVMQLYREVSLARTI